MKTITIAVTAIVLTPGIASALDCMGMTGDEAAACRQTCAADPAACLPKKPHQDEIDELARIQRLNLEAQKNPNLSMEQALELGLARMRYYELTGHWPPDE